MIRRLLAGSLALSLAGCSATQDIPLVDESPRSRILSVTPIKIEVDSSWLGNRTYTEEQTALIVGANRRFSTTINPQTGENIGGGDQFRKLYFELKQRATENPGLNHVYDLMIAMFSVPSISDKDFYERNKDLLDDLVTFFEDIAQKNPNNPVAHVNVARAYDRRKVESDENSPAVIHYNRAEGLLRTLKPEGRVYRTHVQKSNLDHPDLLESVLGEIAFGPHSWPHPSLKAPRIRGDAPWTITGNALERLLEMQGDYVMVLATSGYINYVNGKLDLAKERLIRARRVYSDQKMENPNLLLFIDSGLKSLGVDPNSLRKKVDF